MFPQSAALPSAVPYATRRLFIGLALSLAAHVALVLMLRTSPGHGPAQPAPPQPLQVEIRAADAPPQPTTELALENLPSEAPAEPVTASRPESTPQQPLPPALPQRDAAVANLPLDRYFTAGELDARAEPINDVDLVYPVRAYQMRLRGKVTLRMFINERGSLDEVTVLESTPPGVFEEAALTAALALQFRPAVKNGRDVKSQKTIEVVFDPYERINTP